MTLRWRAFPAVGGYLSEASALRPNKEKGLNMNYLKAIATAFIAVLATASFSSTAEAQEGECILTVANHSGEPIRYTIMGTQKAGKNGWTSYWLTNLASGKYKKIQVPSGQQRSLTFAAAGRKDSATFRYRIRYQKGKRGRKNKKWKVRWHKTESGFSNCIKGHDIVIR